MKILSVKQPWADLVCKGFKDVENRTWRTNYRGELYIHSPKTFDPGAKWFMDERGLNVLPKHHLSNPYAHLRFSTIIGKVNLVDCVQGYGSLWAEKGFWHWVVADPVFFDNFSRKVNGQLGLFEPDPDIEDAIKNYEKGRMWI